MQFSKKISINSIYSFFDISRIINFFATVQHENMIKMEVDWNKVFIFIRDGANKTGGLDGQKSNISSFFFRFFT